jgi:hypothetical protein
MKDTRIDVFLLSFLHLWIDKVEIEHGASSVQQGISTTCNKQFRLISHKGIYMHTQTMLLHVCYRRKLYTFQE